MPREPRPCYCGKARDAPPYGCRCSGSPMWFSLSQVDLDFRIPATPSIHAALRGVVTEPGTPDEIEAEMLARWQEKNLAVPTRRVGVIPGRPLGRSR